MNGRLGKARAAIALAGMLIAAGLFGAASVRAAEV